MSEASFRIRRNRSGQRSQGNKGAQARTGRNSSLSSRNLVGPAAICLLSKNTVSITLFIAIALSVTSYFLFVNRAAPLPADGTPFSIVDLPGRGKGLIASRDIEQGELIIREEPLVLVPKSVNVSPVALIKERIGHLSPIERQAFYALSHVVPGEKEASSTSFSDDEIALAIFQTNAISAGENVGLFPRTARLNHGCSAAFNSVYSWRAHEGVLVVHALKQIKRGQELLTTYTDTKKPRGERQDYLRNLYDFNCTCSVCSLSPPESVASDNRLVLMGSLSRAFASWGDGHLDGKNATHIAERIWALGEEEGYWSERGRLAADVVHIAAAHSDEQAVIAWAFLAQKWFSIELGKGCMQTQEMIVLLSNPRSHFAWSTRKPQAIGLPDIII